MNSSKGPTSLRNHLPTSLRLLALRSYFSSEKHIWDIGCDHGQLGLSFVSEKGVEEIHLVDPSAQVMDRLQQDVSSLALKDSYITKSSLFFHTNKGQEIKIEKKSNLIFISGMGGKEILEIVRHLLSFLDSTSKFVLSPHRKILELRRELRELPLSFEREELMEEKGVFYQIFSLIPSPQPVRKISLYGEEIWDSSLGKLYRDQQIRFFSLHHDELSRNYVNYLK